MRLSTGFSRGSGLEEPDAGVQLCLVGENGDAVLHTISPLFDPQKLQLELEAINKVSTSSLCFARNLTAEQDAAQ